MMDGLATNHSDLNVYHSLRTLQQHAGRGTAIGAATNFYDIAGGVSGGTMASIAASSASADSKVQGEWCLVPSEYHMHFTHRLFVCGPWHFVDEQCMRIRDRLADAQAAGTHTSARPHPSSSSIVLLCL